MRDELDVEERAGQMYREDTRHMKAVKPWERLGGDWLEEQIRAAYLRSAARERAASVSIEVSR